MRRGPAPTGEDLEAEVETAEEDPISAGEAVIRIGSTFRKNCPRSIFRSLRPFDILRAVSSAKRGIERLETERGVSSKGVK